MFFIKENLFFLSLFLLGSVFGFSIHEIERNYFLLYSNTKTISINENISQASMQGNYDSNFVSEFLEDTMIKDQSINYIQGAHNFIIYSLSGDNNGSYVKVNNIDGCRKTTGMSMQPTIFTGYTICYKKYLPSMKRELQEGMIVSFNDGSQYEIGHRIRAVYQDHLLIQGDNNEGFERVNFSNITNIITTILLT